MTTNQYTFNGDGQRVQIVDSEGTKKPIWDFENILLETDGSNVSQVIYTLEPNVYGNIVSQRRGSTASSYLFDALGSTRKLTNSAGSVTDSYDFRAYGETFASSGSTVNVFRWVGELGYYLDIDRLAYYLRARPYNPAIAKFLSQDPLGYESSSWNLYEYTGSSPLILADPSGNRCVKCSCEYQPTGPWANPWRWTVEIDCPMEGTNLTYAQCCMNARACAGRSIGPPKVTGAVPCEDPPMQYCSWWDIYLDCSRSGCQVDCFRDWAVCEAGCATLCAPLKLFKFAYLKCLSDCTNAACTPYTVACVLGCERCRNP
jgi:RHS repeat-associated protein